MNMAWATDPSFWSHSCGDSERMTREVTVLVLFVLVLLVVVLGGAVGAASVRVAIYSI